MIKQYCIYAQFQSDELSIVEEIRKKYDPLFNKIPPHITLVFPFHFEKSNVVEIVNKIEAVIRGIIAFPFEATGVNFQKSYCALNVTRNSSIFEKINNELYTGVLEQFRLKTITYKPHLTLGRYFSPDQKTSIEQDLNLFHIKVFGNVTHIILEEVLEDQTGKPVNIWCLNSSLQKASTLDNFK